MHWRKKNMRAGVDQIPRFLREPLPELPSHPSDWIFYALIGLSVGLGWGAMILVALVSP